MSEKETSEEMKIRNLKRIIRRQQKLIDLSFGCVLMIGGNTVTLEFMREKINGEIREVDPTLFNQKSEG